MDATEARIRIFEGTGGFFFKVIPSNGTAGNTKDRLVKMFMKQIFRFIYGKGVDVLQFAVVIKL